MSGLFGSRCYASSCSLLCTDSATNKFFSGRRVAIRPRRVLEIRLLCGSTLREPWIAPRWRHRTGPGPAANVHIHLKAEFIFRLVFLATLSLCQFSYLTSPCANASIVFGPSNFSVRRRLHRGPPLPRAIHPLACRSGPPRAGRPYDLPRNP